MSCYITDGIDCPSCDAGKKGGLVHNIWLFNWDDLDQGNPVAQVASGDEAGKVTGINLTAYNYGYKWCGVKAKNGAKSFNSYTEELQEGGYYNQTVNGRFRAADQATLNALDSAKDARVIIVVETTNREFLVYGIGGGLELQTLTRSSGLTFADDNSANLGFTGVSDDLAPFLDNGDYESTLNLLNGYLQ